MLGSIPSPDVGTLSLGPLNLRLYGLMVALGVIAAVYMGARLLQRRGLNPEWTVQTATLGVPLGLIGARAYHVLTDWKSYQGRWGDVVKIWEGGLGIPGGILVGVIGGLIVVYVRRLPVRSMVDTAAVGFPVGQAIGRLGNWFNQELFGRPTDLPWALEIDVENRPADYVGDETFHPTFAYEIVWNLLLLGLLLRLDRRGRLPRGHLFAVYLCGYAAGRVWIEALRVDPATLLAGVRVNIWVVGGVGVLSLLFLLTATRRGIAAAAAGAPALIEAHLLAEATEAEETPEETPAGPAEEVAEEVIEEAVEPEAEAGADEVSEPEETPEGPAGEVIEEAVEPEAEAGADEVSEAEETPEGPAEEVIEEAVEPEAETGAAEVSEAEDVEDDSEPHESASAPEDSESGADVEADADDEPADDEPAADGESTGDEPADADEPADDGELTGDEPADEPVAQDAAEDTPAEDAPAEDTPAEVSEPAGRRGRARRIGRRR